MEEVGGSIPSSSTLSWSVRSLANRRIRVRRTRSPARAASQSGPIGTRVDGSPRLRFRFALDDGGTRSSPGRGPARLPRRRRRPPDDHRERAGWLPTVKYSVSGRKGIREARHPLLRPVPHRWRQAQRSTAVARAVRRVRDQLPLEMGRGAIALRHTRLREAGTRTGAVPCPLLPGDRLLNCRRSSQDSSPPRGTSNDAPSEHVRFRRGAWAPTDQQTGRRAARVLRLRDDDVASRAGGRTSTTRSTFIVRRMRDLVEVIVPFMDEHLPPSYKRDQYEVWRTALLGTGSTGCGVGGRARWSGAPTPASQGPLPAPLLRGVQALTGDRGPGGRR